MEANVATTEAVDVCGKPNGAAIVARLDPAELRGMVLVVGRLKCVDCASDAEASTAAMRLMSEA